MYTVDAIQAQPKTLTLRGELYRLKPIEQQEFDGDCESKIIGMSGITNEQFQLALKIVFPEWTLFCIWEMQPDEF